MIYRLPRFRSAQAGFTIVELMIATLVFSSVMILITVGVLSFTRSYYKGINQSNTQNAARLISENISQAVQFSGESITSPIAASTDGEPQSRGICIGDQRYSYLPGWQVSDGPADDSLNRNRYGLVMDKPGSCSGLSAQNLRAAVTDGSTELLPPMMRISKLQVERMTGTSDTWRVTVRVVYGDNDLLNNPTAEDASCKVSISGSQYCAQAELTTYVKKRIN